MDPIDSAGRPRPIEAPAATDTCPRCGGAFQCGVAGDGPCDCTRITLTPQQRAALQQRYRGCLCVRCLREISAAPAGGAC